MAYVIKFNVTATGDASTSLDRTVFTAGMASHLNISADTDWSVPREPTPRGAAAQRHTRPLPTHIADGCGPLTHSWHRHSHTAAPHTDTDTDTARHLRAHRWHGAAWTPVSIEDVVQVTPPA